VSGENGAVPRKMHLELPAVHRWVRVARNVVRRFGRMSGVGDKDLDVLILVTSELLENAVDHGGGEAAREEWERDSDSRMSLELQLFPDRWRIKVDDQGGGDPEELQKLANPDGLPDLENERGRGFFLMSEMVDSLNIERSDDGKGIAVVAVRSHGRPD